MTPVLRHRNGTLFVDNTPIEQGAVAETYLTAEGTAAASTLTVRNIIGFAINQIVLIEDLGLENAEIILTHASSAPSGTTVTLASALVKTHPAGSKVRVITFNQFELTNATTATGSKTALTVATTANANPPSGLGSGLVAIDATTKIQTVASTEHSSGFYFARYKNSITALFGGYTDALAYGGWSQNTVGYIMNQALKRLKQTLSSTLTKEYCYDELNSGLKYIQGKQLRWPEHYSYDAVLGQASRGDNTITMPSDAYDTESNKSLIALRVGTSDNLTYLDPLAFDEYSSPHAHTQVTTQATAGATTLEIDNSYDFDDSGSVNVYVSGTKHNITYTGVTRSSTAGILTGVPASGTGSITVTIAVDTDVWQDEREGVPTHFTVRNGAIEYWPLVDANNDNANVTGDYAKVVTAIDSDGDTIDYQRFDMLLDYLTWKVKALVRHDGELNYNDGYFISFKEKLNDAIRTLPRNIVYKMSPKLNTMSRRGGAWRSTRGWYSTDS